MSEIGVDKGRATQWVKFKALRIVQFVGLGFIGIGAYPFIRPFVKTFIEPPNAIDSFVESFGIQLFSFGEMATAGARGIAFIAVGAIVVWIATSRKLNKI